MFYSDDIVRLFPRHTEIRRIALKDRLVNCRLRIHCLAEGSLDPLVVSIFELLSREPSSIKTLTRSLNGRGRAGIRAIAQTLLALEQAGEIKVENNQSDPVCSISKSSWWSESPAQELALESPFQYLPRSKDFGLFIPATCTRDLPNIHWWNRRDMTELYQATEMRVSMINEACSLYYANTSAIPSLGANKWRSEVLQRSSLLSVKLRFLRADIIDWDDTSDLWNIHRCFLGRIDGEREDAWNIIVARYPRGQRNYKYEQYFRLLKKVDPDAVADLINSAMLL